MEPTPAWGTRGRGVLKDSELTRPEGTLDDCEHCAIRIQTRRDPGQHIVGMGDGVAGHCAILLGNPGETPQDNPTFER